MKDRKQYDAVKHLNHVNSLHSRIEAQYERYRSAVNKYINCYAALFRIQELYRKTNGQKMITSLLMKLSHSIKQFSFGRCGMKEIIRLNYIKLMEDNIMQKNSFIYKGYYYEYSKEELEPEVYLKELEPSLIQLLEKRKNKIKDIMSSSTVDAAVTSEFYMCNILELEDEIEQYMYNSKQYFEWYHSTIGEKKENIHLLENQQRLYCQDCGKEFDLDFYLHIPNFTYQDARICPECSGTLNVKNRYKHLANQCEKEAQEAEEESQFARAINSYKEQLQFLRKVNQYDTDIYISAQFEIGQALKRIYKCGVEIKQAKQYINYLKDAIDLYEQLKEEDKLIWYNNIDLAEGYILFESYHVGESHMINEATLYFSKAKKSIDWIYDIFLSLIDDPECSIPREEIKSYLGELEHLLLQGYRLLCVYYIVEDPKNTLLKQYMTEWSKAFSKSKNVNGNYLENEKKFYNKINNRMMMYQRSNPNMDGCYITTACVGHKGFADDCDIMKTLRWFRDYYMKSNKDLKEDVEEYYKIAPEIVTSINKRIDRDTIWENVYKDMILPCFNYIKSKKFDSAYILYKKYSLMLQKKYTNNLG